MSKCGVSHRVARKSGANRLNETRSGANARAVSNRAVKVRGGAGKKASKNVHRVKIGPREKIDRRVASVGRVKRASKAVSEAEEEVAVAAEEAGVDAAKAVLELAKAASARINVAMRAANANSEVNAADRIIVARRVISMRRAKPTVKFGRLRKTLLRALRRSQHRRRNQFAKNRRSRRQ